jgi:hypothetical protein
MKLGTIKVRMMMYLKIMIKTKNKTTRDIIS